MWDVLVRLIPSLELTIKLSLTALIMATPIGIGLGTLRATLRDRSFAARILDSYVLMVRGTPILIQIFAVYFLLPLTGLKIPLYWLGVLALVFNSAGYQIEIARAAVNSVPNGQWEAAAAIGFNRSQLLLTFILPQAARRMAGPVMNELSQLIKASSVLSVITLYELHKAAEAIISANFRFVEVLIVEGFWYFVFVYTLVMIAQRIERLFSASGGLAEQR